MISSAKRLPMLLQAPSPCAEDVVAQAGGSLFIRKNQQETTLVWQPYAESFLEFGPPIVIVLRLGSLLERSERPRNASFIALESDVIKDEGARNAVESIFAALPRVRLAPSS